MRTLLILSTFLAAVCSAVEPGKGSQLYKQWVEKPERERVDKMAAQSAQRAHNILAEIVIQGDIISTGEGPDGRSHTYVVNYNGLLYSCYFEILGTGRCEKVSAVK
ncbi:MAG: hypothetical protein OSA42_03470 [Porticoccaceae bacterium]|nr:hypothetical protein [Porticoccaceae bacterium]